ncbi:MAG: permease prefix domain 1-containing protein [Bacillus sp. (in: Bacteria)]|nr:permease prefix domain 1-containing protein [Bacillus sp. (in: firmicutes)]
MMTTESNAYITKLKATLQNSQIGNAEEIVREYEVHLHEKTYELMLSGRKEQDALKEAIKQMPSPEEVAVTFQLTNESRNRISPNGKILSFLNCSILLLGMILTLLYAGRGYESFQPIWSTMVDFKWQILFLYTAAWLGAGYLYGLSNGFYKKKRFDKSVAAAIVPNYIFMIVVIAGIYFGWTQQWFGFLLQSSMFLFLCIVVTMSFYPIVQLGHRLGAIRGI